MFHYGIFSDPKSRTRYPTISMTCKPPHTPKWASTVEDRHDPERLATMIGRSTYVDPKNILHEDGRILTCLEDQEGNFLRYAVTEEEIEAALRDPHQFVVGPLDSRWRTEAGSH